MKIEQYYTIILALILSIVVLNAQTPKWVSTEVEKRVAVIEYFTGIYHQAAIDQDFLENYYFPKHPDQFIFIHNHCTDSAAPKAGTNHPDLRTDEGKIIFEELKLKTDSLSYEELPFAEPPYGSLNRIPIFIGWRIPWHNNFGNVIYDTSIVNVYVKPSIDFTTRELTVEVEYYYTDDSPAEINYLTVMLLQNNIICHQNGGLNYRDYVVDDTLYRQMHVLRKVISTGGAWGDSITVTKKGSYELRKYTVKLPESINNVPLVLTDLEVAAFIAEDKYNIYSGHKAAVEIPENVRTDLVVEDITEYHDTYKFETIHPKIKITNNYEQPVTKFDVIYSLKNDYGVVIDTNTYSGVLNQGESVIFDFKEVTKSDLKYGSAYIAEASVVSIFSDETELVDTNKTDNETKIIKYALFENAFTKIKISFENELIPPHSILDNSLNHKFKIYKESYSGAKNTEASLLYYLHYSWGVYNTPGYIIFGEVDCQENPNKTLSYYYAYSNGYLEALPPKIITEISKDWGETWETISEITCEETGLPETVSKLYVPKPEEYKLVRIDLSEYTKENFIVRIGGFPGSSGNSLWLDEILLTNAGEESIKERINLSVYPNPTTNILHINNNNLLGEGYEIYDLSGKLIIKDINNSNIINVGNLSTGTYSLKIKDSIFNFIKK